MPENHLTRGENIKSLCHYITQTAPDDVMPSEMLVKQVASKVFCARARTVGRLTLAAQAIDHESGFVNWDILGPYFVEWDGEMSSKIRHISNEVEEVPLDGRFYAKAARENWRLDMNAVVRTKFGPVALHAFFKDGEGPHRHKIDKAGEMLALLARKFEQQLNKQMDFAKKDIVREVKMPDLHAEKRLAALARARVMLQNRKQGEPVAADGSQLVALADGQEVVESATQ